MGEVGMGWRLLAMALLVAGATACTASNGETPSRDERRSDAFVRGRVLADGEPVSGVRVSVRLEKPGSPDGRRHADYLDDGGYDASARTGDDGTYVVEVDPRDLADELFTDERSVTYGLGLTARGRSMGWGGTAWLVGDDRTWRTDPLADGDDRVLEVDIDVVRGRVRVTSSSGDTETHGLAWVGAAPAP
ncbi:hypothetical protein EKO23_05960 [Nocardioides guangzhouensis]|uniref:Carboxypeptidase regulatory-like domain-containing protein n=1 Tax=Nocardioides guangzhouensis TaxID=2497878 RepID=A0A4Q4ZH76_9ACTN|nr:hypothetical protein [Nocardioides guangzhouensis]RYP87577.1 hypothetical protein EKO23_05960 [Nocardioides guangzhouensis]